VAETRFASSTVVVARRLKAVKDALEKMAMDLNGRCSR